MSWITYALLAPVLFTCGNFIDKYLIEHEVHDTRAMPVYAAIMATLAGIVLWVLTGFPTPPLTNVIPVMVVGALTSLGAVLYFSAMGQEEASRVIVLFQMQPVFVLVLSLVFLNEIINAQQLLGFVLILGAAVAISLNREGSGGGFKLSRAFFLILLTDLIWSSSIVLLKAAVGEVNLFDVFAYESWGLALGGFILYLFVPSLRHAFHRSIKVVSRRGLGILAFNESMFVVAKLVAFTAVLLGPVALVSVLGSTQVFIGIVLGALLTRILPRLFQENISRDVLVRKGLLAVVMFGGILLVS